MDIQELYTLINGDLQGLTERLGSDRLINTLLKLFADDKNYGELIKAMEDKNYADAFRAAHGLKGLCANLAVIKLGNMAAEITEALRDSADIDKAQLLLPMIEEEYEKVTKNIADYINALS